MATVITISAAGEVRIVVGECDPGEACPPSDPLVRQSDLALAVQTLQQGQEHTNQLISALATRVEAVYQAVRQPGTLVVSYGPPQPETQE